MDSDDVDDRERVFHAAVRDYTVWGLLFLILYVLSYVIICNFKQRTDHEDVFSSDSGDVAVYRTSLWLSTFTLAVSIGAVLLLPISIAANEALLMFPKSYYLKWLNSSLIHGMWNQIFLFSNVAVFILMPFAYLFTESEGLPGSKKGIMSRVYETALVLILLAFLVCGLAYVASALIDNDSPSRQALFDIWNFYLPFLYSCISLLGVVMLLICTPVGFARLFTVVGDLVIKPRFLRNLDEELYSIQFEEESLRRKMHQRHNGGVVNGDLNGCAAGLAERLDEVIQDKQEIQKRRQVSALRRNLGYPLMMLLLLFLTTISMLMVARNTFDLLTGLRALPTATQEIVLGISSISTFGPLGAIVQISIILYLMVTSVVGIYSIPFCECLKPRRDDTPMTKVIANCVIILVLSSALPVLSRTLGITNFDLLGNFGSMDWIGNFYIILSYNLAFIVATAICLFTKFTATLRRELLDRLESAIFSSKANQSAESSHIKDE
ncbi:hypothetical protein CAPTEDRAFT_167057 [Capitella teleta]|uniref:Uncharacterized protein n=1 Tax=Capitella teleta TaxID=283909 RepID=R7U746_CAPTE|nr:hypothetical protein CAPTEDRAFT_167057 [Capitella teleta]|eukprot:ELT98960.1 hypothetical protein CAPTEDRAFT_167057 [Capitella teleta]